MSRKRVVSGIVLTILFASMTTLAFNTHSSVKAGGTIYIRPDGSVDPPIPQINRDGDVYTFTGDINDCIVIERDNLTLDGSGHTLRGTGSGTGIELVGNWNDWKTNVTIRNTKITEFYYGILAQYSSDTNILGNNITNNVCGIRLMSCAGASVTANIITTNRHGIYLHRYDSSSNEIAENNITANEIGIELHDSTRNNFISGNNIINNGHGIHLSATGSYDPSGGRVRSNFLFLNILVNNEYGIHLDWSRDNNVSQNKITDGTYGILLEDISLNNNIYENEITGSSYGILLLNQCSENMFENNSMVNNTYSFGIYSTSYEGFVNYADSSNTVNDNPIYYWFEKRDMVVPDDAGFVGLVNCTNIAVKDLTLEDNFQSVMVVNSENITITQNKLSGNEHGIWIHHSSNNVIHNNNIMSNGYGITLLDHSQYNNITLNTIALNSEAGMHLDWSSTNLIYLNDFINNTVQVKTSDSVNMWDNGSLGNFWSDLVCADENLDLICDTAYVIDQYNVDHYPLVKNYTYLTITATPGGTTYPAPAPYIGIKGSSQVVEAKPEQGYSFDYWLLDGVRNETNPITVFFDVNHTLEAFFVDNIAPEMSVPVQNPSIVDAYQNVAVAVDVTDLGSGVHNVTLSYSIDRIAWMNLTMIEISDHSYQTTIPGYENGTPVAYKIIAFDKNENYAVLDNNGGYYAYYVTVPEDVDGDGQVNIVDVSKAAHAFHKEPGEDDWNERADIDKNGIINILDIAKIASEVGKS